MATERAKSTILLVEDNNDDIELTLHAFRRRRIANEVVVVRNGADALDYLFATGAYADRSPDDLPALVLLDLHLPKVSGLEVLRRLRASELGPLVPVVILTTSDSEEDVVQGYRLGVNSYIRKPVDFDEFSRVIEQVGLYWLVLNLGAPRPGEVG
jgi:two-component system response regulator